MRALVRFIGKFAKLSARTEEYLGYRSLMQRNEELRRRALLNRRTQG